MSKIHEILPQHAVDALPSLECEYLAEQLWVHAQNLINAKAHVFAGGYITYNEATKEASVKLDSLDHEDVGDSNIIELTISYTNESLALTKIVFNERNPYSERVVENWSFEAKRSYAEDLESDPIPTRVRDALTRIFSTNTDRVSQGAALQELNSNPYLHEYIKTLVSTPLKNEELVKRVQFGLENSGIRDLAFDSYELYDNAKAYDTLQCMDWIYEVYNQQTPNKPFVLVNEHNQYIMLHVNENKDDRLEGTKVEVYTGSLDKNPIEVGVEVYHGLSKVKRQRTLDTFMQHEDAQTYYQSLDFEVPLDEKLVQRPFWNVLNNATQWRPATELDIKQWLTLDPPEDMEPDGNGQNLLDMYCAAQETWLQLWKEYPNGLAAFNTADTLYDVGDQERVNYLFTKLIESTMEPSKTNSSELSLG